MGGLATVLVGFGIIAVIYGLIQRAKVGRLNAPLFPTGRLGHGGAASAGPNGMASAQGTVVCQQPLFSPVSGKPCLFYSLKVTSERKEGDKTVTKTLREEKVSAQFAVDDGSGPLFIDAREGGDFEPEETFRDSKKTSLLGGITGQAIQFGNFQLDTGILALGTEYKIEEKVLPVVQMLYVNGKMSQQGQNVLSKPGFPRSMILSNKGRDEVLGSAQKGAKYSLMGGAGAAVVGTIIGVVSTYLGGGDAKADDAVAAASAVAPAPALDAAANPAASETVPAAAAPGALTKRTTTGGTKAPAKPATTTTTDAKAPTAPAETTAPATTKPPSTKGDTTKPPSGGTRLGGKTPPKKKE